MRLAVVAAAALAFAGAAGAAGNFVPLPSPIAPLSSSPPLAGGATATSERVRHRVSALTRVEVSVDGSGSPFAVVATQRLVVRVTGDYFFTIGAPLLDVEAGAGSESTPGLRASSIVWAGFDPGTRRLTARATLDPAAVAPSLPVRIDVANGRTVLVNTTGVTVGSFTVDATRAPLVAYLTRLRRDVAAGRTPSSGIALATSKPQSTRVLVRVPLTVRGTIGEHAVDATFAGRLAVPALGDIHLTIHPADGVVVGDTSQLSGRQLLERATLLTLQVARARQYNTFLGNPDPAGPSRTSYVYRTATRPAPPVAVAAPKHRYDWTRTLMTAAALVAAAFLALLAWARA